MQINYKSDFKIHLPLTDAAGASIPFPDYDFRIELTTTKRDRVFTASSVGGELTNCTDDNGRILVVADSHGLPPGRLHCRFTAYIPDPAFPDGINEQIQETDLDIWLVPGIADIPAHISGRIKLPGGKEKAKKRADLVRPILRRGTIPPLAQPGNAYKVYRHETREIWITDAAEEEGGHWQEQIVTRFILGVSCAAVEKGLYYGALFPNGQYIPYSGASPIDIEFEFNHIYDSNPIIDRENCLIKGLVLVEGISYVDIIVPYPISSVVTVDKKGRLIEATNWQEPELHEAPGDIFPDYIPVPRDGDKKDFENLFKPYKGGLQVQSYRLSAYRRSVGNGEKRMALKGAPSRVRWGSPTSYSYLFRVRLVHGKRSYPLTKWAYYLRLDSHKTWPQRENCQYAYKRIK